jgi:putative nucleotidyltransferase with HDIG domain
MVRCPGQDQRFWKPDDVFEIKCRHCGKSVEFFKDEPKLKCRDCGQMVVNPKIDMGCAQWCQYAEQCLGVSLAQDASFMRSKLVGEMEKVFAGDQRRIDHAMEVLDYAEEIQRAEGGDPLVVKAAGILHDIGIPQAQRKYGSAAGKYQEMEGPAIAREILERYDIPADTVDHVCRIVGSHHSGSDIDTIEFRCIWDADHLVNVREEHADEQDIELRKLIDKALKTDKAREMATGLLSDRMPRVNGDAGSE